MLRGIHDHVELIKSSLCIGRYFLPLETRDPYHNFCLRYPGQNIIITGSRRGYR
jgi:hypothetical protein